MVKHLSYSKSRYILNEREKYPNLWTKLCTNSLGVKGREEGRVKLSPSDGMEKEEGKGGRGVIPPGVETTFETFENIRPIGREKEKYQSSVVDNGNGRHLVEWRLSLSLKEEKEEGGRGGGVN